MKLLTSYLLECILVALVFINVAVYSDIVLDNTPVLRVSYLDVGQGDSILIQGPTGNTMLVDGGVDRSVLRELPKELPFFARQIDMVVETHPDKDHIAGLIDVFERYTVSYLIHPGIPGTTEVAKALVQKAADEKGLQQFLARRGQRIHLGGGAYADVLFPDRDVSRGETNDGSIVLHVVYGETSFMLTGDLPSTVENYLAGLDAHSGKLKSDVLKAGHHGSRFSTSDVWLAAVQPSTVVISAGKGNTYGHPSIDVLERVKNEGAKVVSTIDLGTITFTSDGKTISQK
jgi:competence protein ComEC